MCKKGTEFSSPGTGVPVGQQRGQRGSENGRPYDAQTLESLGEKLELNLQMLFQQGDDAYHQSWSVGSCTCPHLEVGAQVRNWRWRTSQEVAETDQGWK